MTLPSMRANQASQEYLRIAGGVGAAATGTSPAGGLDIDNAGRLATDGDITTAGQLQAGSVACAGALSAASGTVSGQMLAGTLNCAGLLATSSEIVSGQLVAGSLSCTGAASLGGTLTTRDVTLSGRLSLGAGGSNRLWSYYVAGNQLMRVGGGVAEIVIFNSSNAYFPVLRMPCDNNYNLGFSAALPPDYDGGPIAFRVFWTATASATGNVCWNVRPNTLADGESMDISTGTGYMNFTDTFMGAKVLHVAVATLTPGWATAGDRFLSLIMQRRGVDASDTFDADVFLIGVDVSY